MIYILFVGCFLLLFIAYILNGKNLLSPVFNICLSFCIALTILLPVYTNWGYHYTPYGVWMVLCCLTSIIVGHCIGSAIYRYAHPAATAAVIYPLNQTYYPIKARHILIISLLGISLMCLYISSLCESAYRLGWNGDAAKLVRFLRNAHVSSVDAIATPTYITLLRLFFKALCYYLIYLSLHNYILFNRKNWSVVIPVAAFLSMDLVTGGRIAILRLGAFIYAVILIKIYQVRQPSNSVTYKAMKYGCLSFTSIILPLFFIVGLARKSYVRGIYNELAIYGGSSLISFDMYLNSPNVPNAFFGEECLGGLYRLVSKFGFVLPRGERFLEYCYWSDNYLYRSNIYTAFRRYIQDFDVGGALLLLLLIGVLSAFCFEKIRMHRAGTFFTIIYASCFYIWLEFVIEERLMNTLITASNFSFFLFVYIIVFAHERIIRQRYT